MESFFAKLYGKKNGKNNSKVISKCLIALVVLILVSCLSGGVVEATYQSRPGFTALVNTTAENFFKGIREMETSSGPMGLNASLDSSYNDDSGNGIDVHMIKNSEWGAVAMLAMSGYGGGSANNIDSYTTGSGNYTGVYAMGDGNWEYTMTFASTDGTSPNTSGNTYQTNLVNLGIDSKYYDLYYVTDTLGYDDNDEFYSYNYSAANAGARLNHNGDAIYEMYQILLNQKTGVDVRRRTITLGHPFFVRGSGGNGGVLASYNDGGYAYSDSTSRAVVVCGSGL